MSTIKATNFQHPSAASPAIVLDAAGGATVAGMGLVHIHTEAISAVGSTSINSVFTSTFDSYKILIDGVPSTTTATRLRWRVGGADNTANQYIGQIIDASNTTLIGVRSTATSWGYGTSSTAGSAFELTVWNVAKASVTMGHSNILNDATTPVTRYIGLTHNVSTAFDGLTFSVDSGTFTGTIRIYGYVNS